MARTCTLEASRGRAAARQTEYRQGRGKCHSSVLEAGRSGSLGRRKRIQALVMVRVQEHGNWE